MDRPVTFATDLIQEIRGGVKAANFAAYLLLMIFLIILGILLAFFIRKMSE